MLTNFILFIVAVLLGMATSLIAFSFFPKKKRIFQDIYFSIEDVDGIGILYTKTGEYSSIIKMDNPVEKFSADINSYYDASHLFNTISLALGEGYAIHKQDIFSRRKFSYNASQKLGYLSLSYFKHFLGRPYTSSLTYLTITYSKAKSKLFSFDEKTWEDFLLKIYKVRDLLLDSGVKAEFLSLKECKDFTNRFFVMDFTEEKISMDNFKVKDKMIATGDRNIKIFSLCDIDACGLPQLLRPYANIEVNNTIMPQDIVSFIDSIPQAENICYNQIIFPANQKKELSILEKKKNRHASIPSPSNQIVVEDIKKVQQAIARDGKQLVYVHFNIIISCKKDVDIEAVTNHLENMFSQRGIILSKRSFNQMELFVNSFPGNCFSMAKDYDRFLTLSDAATCLFYSERNQKTEDTPLKIYYTDRAGTPIAIDITGKEGKNKLSDNSNFFCLGPSGSGKSFHMNSVVRQLYEQQTDIVIVDTGNSYEGLCQYFGGKYISYTTEKPITINPFKITKQENNIEKINFLKNLILQIWKGSQGNASEIESNLIGQTIEEFYKLYFDGKIKEVSFNSFFEFSQVRIKEIVEENELSLIDVKGLIFQMRNFYKGGSYGTILNEDIDTTLFDERFIVFEIDSISDNKTLFPIITLIIMDVFLQKMRLKNNRKLLVIEEAWKAIATPLMAEYIKYMYKTARKFWGIVGIVTQELQDIISSQIVKEAIINNSDVMMLLDQSKFKERFREIKQVLGLTETDCRKIFTINRLENKEAREYFKEIFIRRGLISAVYGVEEPKECYMTYTTERQEKDALKLYREKYPNSSYEEAILKYCQDWRASGISKPIEFAQKVWQENNSS